MPNDMKKELIVGFLSSSDPNDKTSWSGINYSMLNSLKKNGLSVIPLGPVKTPKTLHIILSIINFSHLVFFNKKFNKDHNILLSKYYAIQFKKRLTNKNIDIIFAPSSSTEIAHIKTTIPICYLSGTSFNQIESYYNHYSNLSMPSIKQSNLIEQKAINNSITQVYPSEWAAKHVIDYYKADSNNVFVIPYGANINSAPEKIKIEKKEYNKPLKLLFLGVDWERKGGNTVFDTFKILHDKDYDITLTVCGCVPPITHSKMTVIPFLNKNLDSDSKRFNDLLSESHLLFLPTRSELFGVVFCEAAAFGLPAITTDTGGVGEIVENGVTGYVLSLDATAHDYAEKIQSLYNNPNKLKEMAILSREKFEKKLNWDIWAKKIIEVFLLSIENKST